LATILPDDGLRGLLRRETSYSPYLNPMAMMFAKLKTLLRKAGERSIAAVWNRIGELRSAFSPAECSNDFSHAGYARHPAKRRR